MRLKNIRANLSTNQLKFYYACYDANKSIRFKSNCKFCRKKSLT